MCDCNMFYLVDDVDDWFPIADGERTPLPVPVCPLSVDFRVTDTTDVLPGVSLGMRLGVFESKTYYYISIIFLILRIFYKKNKNTRK